MSIITRRLALGAVIGAVLLSLTGSADSQVPPGTPCNKTKAGYIGCPIPIVSCKEAACAAARCTTTECFSVTKVHVDYFACVSVSESENDLHNGQWLCYQEFIYIAGFPVPVVRPCLDVYYCYVDGTGLCVPNAAYPNQKLHFIYGTDHTCERPS